MKSRYSAYPYVIWMVIFTVVPLLLVAAFAITDSSGAYTLENISAVGEYTPVLMRSIWLA
ncbi:MAG: ABC transporter permease, partial [Oscillospiraceae bacterium]